MSNNKMHLWNYSLYKCCNNNKTTRQPKIFVMCTVEMKLILESLHNCGFRYSDLGFFSLTDKPSTGQYMKTDDDML